MFWDQCACSTQNIRYQPNYFSVAGATHLHLILSYRRLCPIEVSIDFTIKNRQLSTGTLAYVLGSR